MVGVERNRICEQAERKAPYGEENLVHDVE